MVAAVPLPWWSGCDVVVDAVLATELQMVLEAAVPGAGRRYRPADLCSVVGVGAVYGVGLVLEEPTEFVEC